METDESDINIVASIEDARMIGRVVLWIEIDPYSRLIVKIAVRWGRVILASDSAFRQLSETVNTNRARLKACEVDHSLHDIHLVDRSRHNLRVIPLRHYRKRRCSH